MKRSLAPDFAIRFPANEVARSVDILILFNPGRGFGFACGLALIDWFYVTGTDDSPESQTNR